MARNYPSVMFSASSLTPAWNMHNDSWIHPNKCMLILCTCILSPILTLRFHSILFYSILFYSILLISHEMHSSFSPHLPSEITCKAVVEWLWTVICKFLRPLGWNIIQMLLLKYFGFHPLHWLQIFNIFSIHFFSTLLCLILSYKMLTVSFFCAVCSFHWDHDRHLW